MLILNRVMWDESTERVLYPITSLTGFDEGILARMYEELVLRDDTRIAPKAKAYWNTLPEKYTITSLMPPRNAARAEELVVVEDYPSAMCLNRYVPCTALSGTSIQDSSLMNIKAAGVRKLLIVLDADAVAKAAKMVHTYRPFFHEVSFIPMYGADPKDMSNDDLNMLVEQIRERLYGSSNPSELSG
jgi:hypothetical protein